MLASVVTADLGGVGRGARDRVGAFPSQALWALPHPLSTWGACMGRAILGENALQDPRLSWGAIVRARAEAPRKAASPRETPRRAEDVTF